MGHPPLLPLLTLSPDREDREEDVRVIFVATGKVPVARTGVASLEGTPTAMLPPMMDGGVDS